MANGVPEEFRLSEEEFGWLRSERYLGSTDEQLAKAQEAIGRGRFMDFLRDELEADEDLQDELYSWIKSRRQTPAA